jgi:ribosomal protein S18 acetylase RimI-like enzyme
MKRLLRRLIFGLLGKDPEAVVVSFLAGEESLAREMVQEARRLIPNRRHYVVRVGARARIPGTTLVTLEPGSAWSLWRQLRRAFGRLRIGMAPVLLTGERSHRSLRRAAFLLAPRRILAFNAKMERHHLKLSCPIASWLFVRGVPLDRIWLRPVWLTPWKRDRTRRATASAILDGRPLCRLRRRVAVLSPYFPYPLSHGGAVRLFNLLREAAREFDVFLFAFSETGCKEDTAPVREFCAKVILVGKPWYREPRWSSLAPPEVCEYRSGIMKRLWKDLTRQYRIDLRQIEYTCLARYRGEILVEHDVTFDLYRQVFEREHSSPAWWNWWRWRRFETRAVENFARVVTMSEKDSWLLGLAHGTLALPHVRVIGNGVDLERFRPEPEQAGQRLLFIGSFRHFPNVVAYRFLVEQVWPRLRAQFPAMTLTAVAGPEARVHWRLHSDSGAPPAPAGVSLLEFVEDVRPLYVEANLVVVPTLVSAGTNVKVLEAMAMERAVVSTSCGCAGLGLEHGISVWIADTAEEFARGVALLVADPALRSRLAGAARRLAEAHFDWKKLGELQRELWRELSAAGLLTRPAVEGDLEAIRQLQEQCPEAAAWDPASYLSYDCRVAVVGEELAGFIVARKLAGEESEILNLAVAPALRRRGVAAWLLGEVLASAGGPWFLEVRESNQAARSLYGKFGFREVSRRPGYYQDTGEAAVVMRL